MRILTLFWIVFVLLPHPWLSAQEKVPHWRVERVARAGVDDGPGALTVVSGLAVGPDGSAYVSQPQEGILRVYDTRGRFVREIGRSGEGPGEFERPSRLGWRGDTLWVSDPAQMRVSLFRPDGAVIRSITFVRTGSLTGGKPNVPGYLFADGSVLGVWLAPMQLLAGPKPVSQPLVRFTARGEPINVIAQIERLHEFAQMTSGTSVTFMPQPFRDTPLWDVTPDGSNLVIVTRIAAASGRRASFSIRKFHYSGRTIFAKTYRYTPRPLPADAEKKAVDEHVSGLASARIRTSSNGDVRKAIREALYLPRYMPPVTSMVLGRDGTIWLRREETGRSTVSWNVLGPDGRVVARVDLPAKLDVRYADRNQVWGIELDELDVPTLVRLKVIPSR